MKHLETNLTKGVKDRCTETMEHSRQNLQIQMNVVPSLDWGTVGVSGRDVMYLLGVIKYTHCLIMVMVSWVYTYVRTSNSLF